MGDERVEFSEASVIEEAQQAFAGCELATLVLRFDPFFTAAKMGRLSSGLKIVQLRLLNLVLLSVGC